MLRGPVSVVLAAVVVVGTSACPDEVLFEPPGGVTGQVCNPITGRPAAGATLTVTYDDNGTERSAQVVADTTAPSPCPPWAPARSRWS